MSLMRSSRDISAVLSNDSDDDIDDVDDDDDLPGQETDDSDHLSEADEMDNVAELSESDSSDADSSDDDDDDDARTYKSRNGTIKWHKREQRRGRRAPQNILNVPPGPTNRSIDCANVSSSFKLFIAEDMVAMIVRKTNKRAHIVYRQWNDENPNKQRRWKDVDDVELYGFLGLLLLCGVYRARREPVDELWSGEAGFTRPIFTAAMSRTRFKELKRFIRFDDNETRAHRRETDKLAAIRDIVDMFASNCRQSMNPGPYLTVDEHLLVYRGKCPFRQYIPSKPGKYGIKIWVLADAEDYYCSNLQVYTGARQPGAREINQGARVVTELTDHLAEGYGITTDNFFTDIPLASQLLDRNISLVGTVRKNKKEVPQYMLPAKDRPVKSSRFLFYENLTMVSYVPKINKCVILLSTQHHSKDVHGEDKDCKPEIIIHYNATKSGVDCMDKMVKEYRCLRTNRRWPLALFLDLVDIAAQNSFCVWKSLHPEENVKRKFIKAVGMELVMPIIKRRANNLVGLQKNIVDAIRYFVPAKLQRELPANPAKEVGRCSICSRSRDRKSRQKCSVCNAFVCSEHCVKETVVHIKCVQCQAEPE